jgi:1-acyl-sn-glycerol-3-phosphate acyltransferase
MVDPVIVSVYLDAFVIAKAEVGNMPMLNKGAELTGIIYVHRENRESRNETREKMKEMIRGGQNVLVYPEGTVGGNKTTIEFKIGTFLEAAKDGFKVVPIALEYKTARDHWVKISLFKQYFKQFSKWRTYAKIKFGPVLSSEDGHELQQQARDWIDQTILEMQKGWSTAFPDE